MKGLFSRWLVFAALIFMFVVFALHTGLAQTSRSNYNIRHDFTIRPTGVPIIGVVQWSHSQYARANAQVRQGGGTVNYVGPPWPFYRSAQVIAQSGATSANANSEVSINQYIPGGAFQGYVRSSGTATAVGAGNSAQANSWSNVRMRALTWGGWWRFWLNWTPTYSFGVQGSASVVNPPRVRDPFSVLGFDENFNQIYAWEPLRIDADITRTRVLGEGEESRIYWENGIAGVQNALDAQFTIVADDPIISEVQRARGLVRWENGVVVESVATGWLAGRLPGVGFMGDWSGELTIPELEIMLPTATYVDFDFGGGVIPEPSSILGLASGLGILAGFALRRRRA